MAFAQQGSFESTFLHQRKAVAVQMGDLKKPQLVAPEWNSAQLCSTEKSLNSISKPTMPYCLNVKTHVFKKELQEYVPIQANNRIRIETIIYVELSIVDAQDGSLIRSYDYVRMSNRLFATVPDKVMSSNDMESKCILDVDVSVHCPTGNWREEKEACARCVHRMSTKLEQDEKRIIHMLPELYSTEDGDALIKFRSGVANIQFKINCYCSHKKEKEGFVVRFGSQSDLAIAPHTTTPLMFYHENKNRIASRAIIAAAKAQAKAERLELKQRQAQTIRNITKSLTSKTKRGSRKHNSQNSRTGRGHRHYQYRPADSHGLEPPSPPASLTNSPLYHPFSPEMCNVEDNWDSPLSMATPPPTDQLISQSSAIAIQEDQQEAMISHLTPNSGSVRGGTLITIHGSGFTVGELMYVCFGETVVPIFPQRDHMIECFTPAWTKAETVSVLARRPTVHAVHTTPASFTYVDDNERELIKLALQRMMHVSARMSSPMDSVLDRANEFAMLSDLLDSNNDSADGSSMSDLGAQSNFTDLEEMVIDSLKLVDSPLIKSSEGLSAVNSTGHTMLHLSVSLQFATLAKDLVLRGINIEIRDKNGLTALDLACRFRYRPMIDLLASTIDFENGRAVHRFKSRHSPDADNNDCSLVGANPLQRSQCEETDGRSSLASSPPKIMAKQHPTSVGNCDNLHMDFEWESHSDYRVCSSSSSKSVREAVQYHGDYSHKTRRQDNIGEAGATDTSLRTRLRPTIDYASDGRIANIDGQNHARLHEANHHPLPERDMSDVDVFRLDVHMVAAVGRGGVTAARGSGQAVVARRRSNDVQGGSVDDSAREQAVVQSSRRDVESEPVLFLGGVPVTMAQRRRHEGSQASLSSRRCQERDPSSTN
ncbi:SPT3 Dosage dependent suppressor of Ty-induced promoter mutations-like protein [Mortierella polycephala]|uniref:SPT3 Dosage dependent suppressor of Ty-induced promoter mutations-like protein n=1 Tax=Mortierella polycephala TaxID=41804 RepID=A0A9P6UBE4_9FUNG|nr:SPT3 Dosage dependent suppressor of Ty-induced promoter mutations-like protein [Mortierella polycephala]